MRYAESDLDRTLRRRFQTDFNQTLRRIELRSGGMRGLTPFQIPLDFPITAIAGRNGSGKSTLLAIACCAYHGAADGFKLPKRNLPYYRFSDFFIQRTEEGKSGDIQIAYHIAHNNWKKSPAFPDGSGIGMQLRRKKDGGKWNDYDSRVQRTVVFLGIERVVPHIERSQSRSYRHAFGAAVPQGWEDKVRAAVSNVLGKKYESYRPLRHQRYSLPIVKVGGTVYSGFNMGAGENALFEIFSTIYGCGRSALIVIDEIELGLHAEAQHLLIAELKKACLETNCQIICTTHSKEIFDCLPDDARMFVEVRGGRTQVTRGISSLFAFSKLGARHAHELELLVEDEVAKCVVLNALGAEARSRVSVRVIGSAKAVARQLAAAAAKNGGENVIAVFDGDQRNLAAQNTRYARGLAELRSEDFDVWFGEHSCYLPGEVWPEGWLIQKALEHCSTLSPLLGTDEAVLRDALEAAQQAGKHKEFATLAKILGYDDKEPCLQIVAAHICSHCAPDFLEVLSCVEARLT